MFTFSKMLALVESESSFGAYVCHRRPGGSRATSDLVTTTSHRSANQRYFVHNSATGCNRTSQSSALDSSRSQLCNDTSTGVVRHQITKWRRLQNVVSYDVLHHTTRLSDRSALCVARSAGEPCARAEKNLGRGRFSKFSRSAKSRRPRKKGG